MKGSLARMNKKEMIHNLKRVKLVIGNGFDLYCGLKTKYSDYFKFDDSKNKALKNWIDSFNNLYYYADGYRNIANRKDLWVDLLNFKNTNIWDLFFFLVSYENNSFDNWKWCDIESVMLEWLHRNTDKMYFSSIRNFELVYKFIDGSLSKKVDAAVYYLAAFAFKKNNEKKFKNIDEFYSFLLSQLKLFEKEFGQYIYHLQVDDSCKAFLPPKPIITYIEKAEEAICKICTIENIASIDTFNYGTPLIEKIKGKINHINGDVDNPIFGVDSNAFIAPDPRYIFSKTNRRMNLDMIKNESYETKEFENIIIFGSSLSVADYSYFFSIFDKINITDLSNPAKIVFAYNVYDSGKEEAINKQLSKSIFELFQEYSRYKGNNEQPNRLLDSLTTQGKVILYRI